MKIVSLQLCMGINMGKAIYMLNPFVIPAYACGYQEHCVGGQAQHRHTRPTCSYSFLHKLPGAAIQGQCVQKRGRFAPNKFKEDLV